MVKRMVGPGAVSAAALARQVGVSQPTLSQWLREANKLAAMTPPPEEKPVGPKKWTPEEKLRVLAEAHGLAGEALGALLRREGLHEGHLAEWRAAAAGALSQGTKEAPSGALTAGQHRRLAVSEKRVKELERELRRKEKALAEAAALLVLEKKLQAMGWDEKDSGDEDGAADETCEK
nr:transposase [Myxococcus xanthus]